MRLQFIISILALLCSRFSLCQIPDFSKVPNLNDGDSIHIVNLIKNGVEIKREKLICWFPNDSLSDKRMNEIADTLNIGIAAAEKMIKANPRPFYTFYFRIDTFVSHASLSGFVSISFWRIKENKAPGFMKFYMKC